MYNTCCKMIENKTSISALQDIKKIQPMVKRFCKQKSVKKNSKLNYAYAIQKSAMLTIP